MKQMLGKMKQNRAFTMMEMMIVVAITVILLGIAVLSISNITKTMTMNELDNHAKTIFLEAQNQLSAVEVAGGLPKLYDDLQAGYQARFFDSEDKKPSDFDASSLPEENQDDWMNLCYVLKDDAITKEKLILVQSNAYQMEGNYIIEFNPQTGDVYGVFYWTTDSIITYADVISAVGDRTLSARSDKEIGYYGGQMMSTEATNVFLDLKAEFVNEEELYLKISMEKSSRLLRYYRTGALQITCTVTDETGHEWIASTDAECEGVDFIIDVNKGVENIDGLEFYVLLDSLDAGYGFSNITVDRQSNPQTSLTPGDNLQAKVEAEFKQGAYYCLEKDDDNFVNSIFSRKSYITDGVSLEINTVRHLLRFNDYIHNAGAGDTIEVLQTNDIDFANTNFAWINGEFVGKGNTTSLNSVAPIKNAVVFENAGGTDVTTINGGENGGYEIRNFVISATSDNAGLFSVAQNVHFKNIRLEDITVAADGYKNVGMLVGSVTGGSIENTGVYLSTYALNDDGSKNYYSQQVNEGEIYPNEMVKRYDTYKVTGGENVGGLLGSADGVTLINNSFAAVKVEGGTDVGGFIGYAANMPSAVDGENNPISGIWNSYSSGSVVGNTKGAGGLIGYAASIDVTNAYSTSNIYGNDTFAGFAGYSNRCSYTNCKAFGEILNLSGKAENLNRVNGFTRYNNATDNNYYSCAYLKQTSYNASSDLEGLVDARTYVELIANSEDKVSVGASHPYNAALLHKVFPFEKATNSHYGDWPVQYSMNTSLVYYEKYKNFDGSYTYGFYCKSKLTSKEEDDIANDYIWVLDTLQNRECVEDGYALLSTHNLEKFSYEIYVGSDDTVDYQNTLNVKYAGEESATSAIYLAQQGSLEFSAYDEDMENFTGVEPKDTYVVTGMYLYQLPYELQNTDRYGVDNFYDKLVIYAGYARGNADEETSTPVIGGKEKDANAVNFFYCPHFARTAMNPGVNESSNLDNPDRVYVRSARQLNNLGRFPYYWNDKSGAAEMTFVQETDVNFGTYTKSYCGNTFDLMDTSSSVANVPIGEAVGTNSYEQFRNSYDGQCYKIIDYCVSSDAQFTGLFGVIRDASLKNIVMTVSKEGAGKVISSYLKDDAIMDESNTYNRAGLGALVGLSDNENNVIQNCVAVGYEVSYHQYAATTGTSLPTGVAIGGLMGYCTTDIDNCAASNDVHFVAHCDYGQNEIVLIGGLAGSFWYGTMDNAYSGGTIDVIFEDEVTGVVYDVDNVVVGALCPGYLNNGESGYSTNAAVYRNVYTYTEVSNHVFEIDGFRYLIPSSGRLQVSGTNTITLTEDMASPGGYLAAYLKPMYEEQLDIIRDQYGNEVTRYFETYRRNIFSRKYTKTCDGLTYEQLSQIGISDVSYDAGNLLNDDDDIKYKISDLTGKGLEDLKRRADYVYPFDVSLAGQEYPFPEFIYRFQRDANGNVKLDGNGNPIREYIHYGDWPEYTDDGEDEEEEGYVFNPGTISDTVLNNPPLDNQHNGDRFSYYGGIFYYEIYEDNTLGMYASGTVYAENSSQKGLIQTLSASKTITSRGIGVFYYGETYTKSDGQYTVTRENGDT
ncbi:MAG: prepilin-type N-terminal cleavage/methylation domain-containing protein, partial [Agathobacter sp.]|nr:prepilin-type N-terminal cleavage/methylation domain-containing protein [Agathobacter sp.]